MRLNKLLGQHFLTDKNVLQKIIDAANPKQDETILEIGPGSGTLTFPLAEKAGNVIAVEKDVRFFQLLKNEIKKRGVKNIELIHADILKLDTSIFAQMHPYRVVANIPYYLTARLIRKLLEEVPQPMDIFFIIQKEVAERITTKPPRMNLLALAVQVYGTPNIIFPITRNAFTPAPEVDSVLLEVKNISKQNFKNEIEEKIFFKIVRSAFQKKRKMLSNSLGRISETKAIIQKTFQTMKKLKTMRPQELTRDDWLTFTRHLIIKREETRSS